MDGQDVADDVSDRFSEILHLTTALADRALDAQIMGRPVPPDQIAALQAAGQLLREYDLPWPPLLAQVLHEASPDAEEEVAPNPSGLARLIGAFRRERSVPAET